MSYCPLISSREGGVLNPCVGSRCAWWGENACIVVELAKAEVIASAAIVESVREQ